MITKEYLEELLSKVGEGLTEKSSIDNLAQLKKADKESSLGIDREETKEPPKEETPKVDEDGLPSVSQFLDQMKGNN